MALCSPLSRHALVRPCKDRRPPSIAGCSGPPGAGGKGRGKGRLLRSAACLRGCCFPMAARGSLIARVFSEEVPGLALSLLERKQVPQMSVGPHLPNRREVCVCQLVLKQLSD